MASLTFFEESDRAVFQSSLLFKLRIQRSMTQDMHGVKPQDEEIMNMVRKRA